MPVFGVRPGAVIVALNGAEANATETVNASNRNAGSASRRMPSMLRLQRGRNLFVVLARGRCDDARAALEVERCSREIVAVDQPDHSSRLEQEQLRRRDVHR